MNNDNPATPNRQSAVDMTRMYARHRKHMRERRPRKGMGHILAAFGVGMIALSVVAVAVWWTVPRPVPAYEVCVGPRSIGVVEDVQAFETLLNEHRQKLGEEYGLDVEFSEKVQFRPVEVYRQFLPAPDQVVKTVDQSMDVQTTATAIYVDGTIAAATKSMEDAEWALNQLLEPLRKFVDAGEIADIGYLEKVEVEQTKVPASMIKSKEEVYHDLVIGTTEKKTYTVQKGDSVRSIADAHDLTVSQLKRANLKLIADDTISQGEVLSLVVPNNVLNVTFNRRVQKMDKLPFETTVKKDSSMYTTQETVIQEGVSGEREIVAKQEYVNGILIGEEVISEKVATKAVPRVIAKGTKKLDDTVTVLANNKSSDGIEVDAGVDLASADDGGEDEELILAKKSSTRYIWPTKGRISSGYGKRWGRLHAGLDIANKKGTPIYAARAGTVSFSGYNNGGYGKMIKISCGKGVEHRYAHCSKLVVKAGKKVKQGQLIAYMGSTGRSTGPHLHFEVRVNGSAKNPRKYLP